MEDESLYRILDVTENRLEIVPITEKNGQIVDTDSDIVQVTNRSENTSVSQVLAFVEPGHIVKGTLLESGSSYQFETVEHRGGFSLVEVDAMSVPYLVQNYWEQKSNVDRASTIETVHLAPLSEIDNYSDVNEFSGELVIQSPLCSEADSWEEFRQGVGGEETYGEFKTISGRPNEVFIGCPAGESYWYALLFPEDRSPPARRVRAQAGYLYDDYYVSNPSWDSAALINKEKLPEKIDEKPKGVLAPGYTVHSSAIPERFGRNTVELLAELVYVGSQFEQTIFSTTDDSLNKNDYTSYEPSDVKDATVSIIETYQFYTKILIEIYEVFVGTGEKTTEGAIDDGLLPPPELLYQARLKFDSQLHEMRAYIKKMRKVPIDKYVIEQFKGMVPDDKKNLRAEYGVEGFPLMIRHILYDIDQQLDTLSDVLKVSDQVATAEKEDNGFRYRLPADEKAYELIKRHQDHVSDNLTPAELGGEGSEVFMLVLGRLGSRHDWLDTSALGTMGTMITQFGDQMRE
jgi:hypothetical protein